MSKARDLADFISTGSILSDGTIESTEISGVTADATEINKLDGLTADTTELNTLDGVTATTAELNKLAGTTATTSDFDKLSNVTASATELNYMTGATSSIQSQLDNISVTSGSLTKSFTNGESATITLAQSITPAPVVSVTKEVAQTGQSSKGAWDVNATASNYDLHNTAYDTTLTASTTTSLADSTYDSLSYTPGVGSNGLDFSPDGTKVYILRPGNNDVAQYGMSTAWAINTINTQYNFSVASQVTDEGGMCLSDDGYHLYVGDKVSPYPTNKIHQYTLTTAYDLSTASFTRTVDFSSTTTYSLGAIRVLDSGTKLYLFLGNGTNILVRQYTMSTAYDVSTATSDNKSFDFYADYGSGGYPRSSKITNDGLNLFLANGADDIVMHYTFSTAWDVTTLSRVGTYDPAEDANVSGTYVKEDLSKMYIYGGSNNKIFQYTLGSSDALTLGTGSFASTDVGKRIQGNGGDVILTSTAGAYDTTGGSDFTDTSTIASGSWTMHGIKSAGDDDGLTLVNKIVGYGDVDTYTNDNISYNYSAQISNLSSGMWFKPDGTAFYLIKATNDRVYRYNLSTAWDLTTASYNSDNAVPTSNGGTHTGISFSPDGTKMFVTNDGFDYLVQYNLSTAWDINSFSAYNAIDMSSSTYGSANNPAGMAWNNDGTKLFVTSQTSNKVVQLNFPTAYTLSGVSLGGTFSTTSQDTNPSGIAFNSDGTKMFVTTYNTDAIFQYSLSTAFDITTASYDNKTLSFASIDGNVRSVFFKDGGQKVYIQGRSNDTIFQFSSGSTTIPTSQYHLAVTNSGGQIDSVFWTDINSMTADQSLGDGEAYYAVSTDDRTTWSVAKGSDGVRPIVRDNAGTWQYNSDGGTTTYYDISSPTYVQGFNISGWSTDPYGICFKPDGTKVYIANDSGNRVNDFDLTTAWDISTITSTSHGGILATGGQETSPSGVQISSDGTKMYVIGYASDAIYQYTLTNAWDVYPSSYANKSLSVTGVGETIPSDIFFKPDGTRLFMVGKTTDKVFEYNLSTAWDLATATYSNNSFSVAGYDTGPQGLSFSSDGTKMFTVGINYVTEWSLSTAWDITTASYAREYDSSAQDTDPHGIAFKSDGSKMYIVGSSSDTIHEYNTSLSSYGTSTTWTNATTNDEFYALQQALGYNAFNRMDKTQLDAVADGSHFTLGNTLDLMIALKQDTASASLPTSDGVTINYDAEALNQGAVLGTDYDFDFPANNKVRITSNAAQNLKIRVV
ncbi:hypothetical protein CRP9_gp42 [Roseobacter phage CRP-9]|nr:hypothetical protein CRP9_gp42 [Roseobacter phage CRP-9]